MIRPPSLLAISALLVLAPVMCVGQEVATTRVDLVIDANGYRIEIVTDAQMLADRMAAVWKQTPGNSLGGPNSDQRFAGFGELLLRKAAIRFDGVTSAPAVTYSLSASSPDVAASITIKLSGAVPAGARVLQWNYGWTRAAYAFTVHPSTDDHPTVIWLEAGQESAPIALDHLTPAPSRWQVAGRYLRLGFTHIIPRGLDHMFFVLGIFLLTSRLKPLLLQVTAFTVAHSLTLGLGVFGFIATTASVVEPLIAISIAYVALENLFVSRLKPWRLTLVFAFGLFHGLGFAGVLRELGLPRSEFVTALVTFNVGVEVGQLAVIGGAFLLVGRWFNRPWYRWRIVVPASALIACAGLFWTFERLTS